MFSLVCKLTCYQKYLLLYPLGNATRDSGKEQGHLNLVMYVAYTITFLSSLFGNSVIIYIIRTDNSLKTTTNYLVMNQACVDIFITLSEPVNFLYHSFTGSLWLRGVIGLITCKVYMTSVYSLPDFSVWILAVIAVDRFYAVVLPLRQSPVSQHLKKIMFILWLWSLAWSVPIVIGENFIKVGQSYYCDLYRLVNKWTILNDIHLAVGVLLPFLLIVCLYTAVCYKLWSRKVPGEGANQIEAQRIAKRVTVMMIAVVVLYAFCWFTLFTFFFLNSHHYLQLNGILLFLVMWLPSLFSGLNPYVYLTFSQNFRKACKKILSNCRFPPQDIRPISVCSQHIELKQR